MQVQITKCCCIEKFIKEKSVIKGEHPLISQYCTAFMDEQGQPIYSTKTPVIFFFYKVLGTLLEE